MESSIPMTGQSFGRKRTVTKFPRFVGNVLVKGVSKVRRQFSGETEALEKGALIATRLSTTHRSLPTDNVQPVLADIVKSLFEDGNPRLQESTAKAVAIAAAELDPQTCLALLEYPKALEGLVRLLFMSNRYVAQEGAALALINLAGAGEECQRKVAQYPNVLAGIVRLLSQDLSAQVQQHGASLIFVLGLLPENQKMIVDFPGVLEGLVDVLLVNKMPLVQGRAALAISALAASQDTKETIADFPQMLMGIMELLNLEDLPGVQECAVVAVANLITAKTTPEILEFPNLLPRLALLAPTCEAALVAIINLDFFRKKHVARQMAEQALAKCRRLPELRLLEYPTGV